MSNHHARPKPSNYKDSSLAMLVLIAVVFTFIGLWVFEKERVEAPWPSVAGRVLETRVAVVGSREGGYRPGVILYRVEAHVTYTVNGQAFDRWLPASDVYGDKADLEFWLSEKKDKLCIVHWNPKNPLDIEAVLS